MAGMPISNATQPCPGCGTSDVKCQEVGAYFGGRMRTRLQCRRCGRTWSVISAATLPELPGDDIETPEPAEWHYGRPELCSCGTRGKVYKTKPGMRYVKCPECDRTWKEIGRAV